MSMVYGILKQIQQWITLYFCQVIHPNEHSYSQQCFNSKVTVRNNAHKVSYCIV